MRNTKIVAAIRRYAIVAPAVAALAFAAASPAAATSGSASSGFSNGASLGANVWIETWADSNGCADFSTSAVISGGHSPVAWNDWVKNYTKFDPWGIAASVTAFGQSGDPVSSSWYNDNGSRGAYLSGVLCTNWRTLGVTGYTTATAYYNGQTKSVTAST